MNTREAFEATWRTLPIPGDYDAMDATDQMMWRAVVEMAHAAGAAWAARECVKECDGAFVCCGNRVVGAEYMGSQEMICCGEPLEMKSAADVADAIRARFPEAFK